MNYLDLTLPTPEENLACDEALLERCDEGLADEMLRVWESPRHFVVVGYANKVATEVNVPFCGQNALPILRRCSGGGTVVQGPGCLSYALILRIDESGPLRTIASTNQFVLERHRGILERLLQAPVHIRGHTDLALRGLKFSGNSQRRKRRALVFHGAFLIQFDLALIERALRMPSKQPDYRANRSHSDFLVNLAVPARQITLALRRGWQAATPPSEIPLERIRELAREKYATPEWTWRFDTAREP
ncbi:MAG: lipoate--protein ligase family protein [Verrucomicrobiota bacterium]|jgi:lipoate-protein ligase A